MPWPCKQFLYSKQDAFVKMKKPMLNIMPQEVKVDGMFCSTLTAVAAIISFNRPPAVKTSFQHQRIMFIKMKCCRTNRQCFYNKNYFAHLA